MIEKLLIVDGHNIASRAYFTNNHFGFYNMILDVVKDVDPDRLAIVFDAPGKTWRHDLYPGYKANREPDEDRQAYIADIKRSLEGLVPVYCMPGQEADDIIASLTGWFQRLPRYCGTHCYILSSDGDLLALVSARVSVIAPAASFKDRVTHDPQSVFDKMGVRPEQIADYKAMAGDRTDGIPGVRNIGPVTARKLLAQYGDKTGILNAISDADWDEEPRWARLIEADEKSLDLSYNLAALRAPVITGPKMAMCEDEGALHKALGKYRAGLP